MSLPHYCSCSYRGAAASPDQALKLSSSVSPIPADSFMLFNSKLRVLLQKLKGVASVLWLVGFSAHEALAVPPQIAGMGEYQHMVPAQLNNYAISWWLLQRHDASTALILLERAVRIAPNLPEIRQNRDRLRDAIRQGDLSGDTLKQGSALHWIGPKPLPERIPPGVLSTGTFAPSLYPALKPAIVLPTTQPALPDSASDAGKAMTHPAIPALWLDFDTTK